MIIWLNGPFGGGKTTVAQALCELDSSLVVFDAEQVGLMLRHTLSEPRPVKDFQDWPPWRTLVVASARAVHDYLGRDLVIPQTVLNHRYWNEISTGFDSVGIPVHAFTLDCAPVEHELRILLDAVESGVRDWRLDKSAAFRDALVWLRKETTVVDTTARTPAHVARGIVGRLPTR